MYNVTVDIEAAILNTELRGFIEPDEIGGYVKDVQIALVMNQFNKEYRLVIDISGCSIQPQATLALLASHIEAMPKAKAIAVIVGDSLAAGQARRLLNQPYTRFVETREQARSWILGEKN